MAFFWVGFQLTACLGFGLYFLKALGLLAQLRLSERLSWGVAVGYGCLGWLLFFIGAGGILTTDAMFGTLLLGSTGTLLLRSKSLPAFEVEEGNCWSWFDTVFASGLVLGLTLDILEGLSPPADADSLAYHFALAKQFADQGRIFFVERAMDGAIPLLNQMTYVPALALGGEKGLTLWTMVSGWGAPALLYTVCRRFIDRRWSLVSATLFLTAPAVVYGGGSGQVEVRNAMFVIVAVFSVAQAISRDDLRYAALAGAAVGFFMGGKYLGLLFALACGLVILMQRRWFVHGLVLTVVTCIFGSQWYVWNFIHTGDPFFPVLFGALDYTTPFWNQEQDVALRTMLRNSEQALSLNPFWLVIYPFLATFPDAPQFGSVRVGLGPYLLLVLPFALGGAWKFRRNLRNHPLMPIVLTVLVFYVLWFLTGSSQRVRHMVPVLPLAIFIFTMAAQRFAATRAMQKPLLAATMFSLVFHLAASGLFGLNYIRHVASDETREAFLQRNVYGYDVVPWINANLNNSDRLYTVARQLNYLLDVPYYYAHRHQEGRIDIRPEANNPAKFFRQIQALGITHLLVGRDPAIKSPSHGIYQWNPLLHAGCLSIAKEIDIYAIQSRTLGQKTPTRAYVLRVAKGSCPL